MTELGVSLYCGLAAKIHNSQKASAVSSKQAERDGQDHATKLENCRVQTLCVPITRTGITKNIVKRSFEPSCYHRGWIEGVRTSLLKQKAGDADELQVCNRWE